MERITRPNAALGQIGLDRQQFRCRARQPIGFRHHQHVAVTQEGQALGQTVTLGDAGNLFGEQLRRTRGGEIAFLRSEADSLIEGAGNGWSPRYGNR
jgi:hypothetical protein